MRMGVARWVVPALAVALGLLIVFAQAGAGARPVQYVLGFAVVLLYGLGLLLLQSRSEVAALLSGLPRDERWASINLRALSLAAQVLAVVLVGAFLVATFAGADPMPYAWTGLVFAVAYFGGIAWYRARD
jgi:biotin transporter BioY